MNLRLIIESLKFHKLKSSNFVKVIFLLIILMRAAVTMLPVGDRKFAFLDYYFQGKMHENIDKIMPTKGNWIIIGIYLIGLFLSVCFGLLYAEIFVLENESSRKPRITLGRDELFLVPIKKNIPRELMTEDKIVQYIKSSFFPSTFKRISTSDEEKQSIFGIAFVDLLRKFPLIVFFSFLVLVTFSLSSTLFFIPFIIFILSFMFTPMNFLYARNKFFRSMELSMAQTNGSKISILISFIMQNFVFSLLMNLLDVTIVDYHYSYLMIEAFIYAFRVLSIARMYGLLYQILALRQPYNVKK